VHVATAAEAGARMCSAGGGAAALPSSITSRLRLPTSTSQARARLASPGGAASGVSSAPSSTTHAIAAFVALSLNLAVAP